MNRGSKSKSAKAAVRGFKLIPFLLIILVMILSYTVVADPTNETIEDTWFDTHWGGDTGEEYYKEPEPEVPEEPEPAPGLCGTSAIVIGICVPAASIQYLKKRREPKIE